MDIYSPELTDVGVLQIANQNLLQLHCLCGCDCVHPYFATVLTDGKNTYQASPYVRGSVIRLPMWCEEDCTFSLAIGFHKGTTVVWVEEHMPNNAGISEIKDTNKQQTKTL